MDGIPLKECFAELFASAAAQANDAVVIDETNVYQAQNLLSRKIMDGIVGDNLLPGSRLEGRGNFEDFYRQMKGGKSGVILCEHYSNLDLPVLVYLLEHDASDFGPALARDIIAVAGMKLNEENPWIKYFAEGYPRLVIYPSRSLATIKDPEILVKEKARSKKINMAAMRALYTARREGKPVAVFPSGTRYRPGKPETKRGLREIDSYLRTFDIMLPVTLNGQCLRFNPDFPNDMLMDLMFSDRMIVAAGRVMECKKFRKGVLGSVCAGQGAEIDCKQAVVDALMEILEKQHQAYQEIWEKE